MEKDPLDVGVFFGQSYSSSRSLITCVSNLIYEILWNQGNDASHDSSWNLAGHHSDTVFLQVPDVCSGWQRRLGRYSSFLYSRHNGRNASPLLDVSDGLMVCSKMVTLQVPKYMISTVGFWVPNMFRFFRFKICSNDIFEPFFNHFSTGCKRLSDHQSLQRSQIGDLTSRLSVLANAGELACVASLKRHQLNKSWFFKFFHLSNLKYVELLQDVGLTEARCEKWCLLAARICVKEGWEVPEKWTEHAWDSRAVFNSMVINNSIN